MRVSIFILILLAGAVSNATEQNIAHISISNTSEILEGTVGVCQIVLPGSVTEPEAAVYDLSPLGNAAQLSVMKKFVSSMGDITKLRGTEKITVLQAPSHGSYSVVDKRPKYYPEPDYGGEDQLTLLVEISNYKIKVIYYIHVGGEGNMENDPCPDPMQIWKISSTLARKVHEQNT